MRVKAMTIAAALVWGGVILLTGLANMARPGFASDFLRAMTSVDPGFHGVHSFATVILGTLYGAVEGGIVGFVFSSIYHLIAAGRRPAAHGM